MHKQFRTAILLLQFVFLCVYSPTVTKTDEYAVGSDRDKMEEAPDPPVRSRSTTTTAVPEPTFGGTVFTTPSTTIARDITSNWTSINTTGSSKYVQIFHDGFSGSILDPSKWNVVTTPSNVVHYVEDEVWKERGHLFIKTQKRNFGGRQFTSGRVDTRGKFSFKYGKVEFRAALPKGKGIFSSFWLTHCTCPPTSPCPPAFGPPAIDVMDAQGNLPYEFTSGLHYKKPNGNNGYESKIVTGSDFTAGFHVYKVLWDRNQVAFYLDGLLTHKFTDKNKIPNVEMCLVINSAMGDGPESADSSTIFPAHLILDYVSVYRKQ